MVDLTYMRRKRRRKTVAIIGAVSSACAIIIGAVAALGQHAAPLTVKLNNANCSLGLAITQESEETKSFLVADNCPAYTENSYNYIFVQYDDPVEVAKMDAKIDSELSGPVLTGDKTSTLYYKYTFFVDNTGDNNADFDIQLGIDRTNSNQSEFDLTDILRVRYYENSDLSQHNSTTYAKSDIERSEDGSLIRKPVHVSTDDTPYCEDFYDAKTIVRSQVKNIAPHEQVRITFMLWLEGFDKDSNGRDAPTDSSLALGVDISAHEATNE